MCVVNGETVASTGDDLDCDVEGLTLTSVVREGGEFLLLANALFGRYRDNGTGEMVDVVNVEDIRISFGLGTVDGAERVLDQLAALLTYWCDTATPLRFIAAVDRDWMRLIDPTGASVPIPRGPILG